MTLKEFVKDFMDANGINKDVDEMCKHITDEARKLAKDGCACLDETQVEQIILGAELEAPKEEPKPEPVKVEEKPKPEPVKPKKKVDEDQLDIFSMGVGLYD